MSVNPKPNGGFEVRWREGGRNRGRSFDRKSDAETFDQHVRRQKQLGEAIPKRTGGETLDEFFAEWLVGRHSLAPRTVALYEWLYEGHVAEYLGYLPLTACTAERLEEWQAKRLKEGAGVEPIRKAGTMLHGVFKRAKRLRKIKENPVEGMEKPRREKGEINPATPKQVETMRAWFLGRDRLGDAVLISVMAYGGLRVGEALGLRWEDFSNGNRLWVCRSLEDDGSVKETKTGRDRLVELPAPAADDLLAWRSVSGAEGFIFGRAKDGTGWTKSDRNNWSRRWFKEAAKVAGWTEPFSKLRHSCASLKIFAGETSMDVAEHMGHSHRVSVDIYQRPLREMRGMERRPVEEIIEEARTSCEQADDKERVGPLSGDPEREADFAWQSHRSL